MASMSPCTIEADVIDAMKKFRRASNKSTMAIICSLISENAIENKIIYYLFLVRCDMKTSQVVIEKELKVNEYFLEWDYSKY